MSCLTKKLLFFMVLCTLCNTAFSGWCSCFDGDTDEKHKHEDEEPLLDNMQEESVEICKANVHLVFDKDLPPHYAFKFAMWSLSENVIGSLTSTSQLLKHLRNQEKKFLFYDNDFADKHKDIVEYLRLLIDRLENQYDTSLESKKHDITGYFKYLVHKLEDKIYCSDIFETLQIHMYSASPEEYCGGLPGNIKLMCETALSNMLHETSDDTKKMEVDKALVYCYLNYTSTDFTKDNFFSKTDNSSTSTTPNETVQEFLLSHMTYYFLKLMYVADGVVLNYSRVDDYNNLFPTVEEYCSGAPSSSAA